MNTWIDSHAHVFSAQFSADRDEMLSRSFEAGVTRLYMPNIDHTSIDTMLEVESKYPGNCFSMMGLHPCSVKADFGQELAIVESWLSKRSFKAVGEMGTDLYWDKTFWEQQKEAFRIQVGWAKKYSLPIVIHCRESMNETLDLLEPLLGDSLTGVFHCFTGNAEQAKRIIAMGFSLGIGGVVTFKNGGLDKVLPEIGMEHIVLETDSPYLAPVPHRGARNEPSFIPLVAHRVSEIKKISLDEVCVATTSNSKKLFGD